MSDKSGVSSQVISLPSGGGALKGIGETFSPDLFTGTGNFTVPLGLPPGRNGFQPQLDLVYSTGNGNGPFGLGWDLSVPGVSRKTSKGVPRYLDTGGLEDQDTFLLSGAEDLVPVDSPKPGATRYQPRTEGLFARIERIRSPEEDFWRVSSKEGLVSLYGASLQGGESPVIADPAQRSNIFCWKLSQTTDPFGNRIEYQYRRDKGSQGPHVWDELYLQKVRYVDYTKNGETRFLVSVTFVYEERPDPFSNYRAGFERRTRLRCKRIEIYTHPGKDLLVRTYELVYLDERVNSGELDKSELPLNNVSLLNQIKVVGHDGNRTEVMPPLEFGYTRFEPNQHRFEPITAVGNALPPRSLASSDFELVDLFGNGLPDIVQMNGTVQFWRNLGKGRFDRPQTMNEIPGGVHLGEPGVLFADMNGNGRADLLALPKMGYFPLSFEGRWSPQSFVQYASAPSVPFGSQDVRLVDLDGDGVTDALRTGTSFELFFNDPQKGWANVETRPRRPLAEFPDLNFTDPRVKLADLTGDNLQDFVLIDQGRVDFWPYLGDGHWGKRVSMPNSPLFKDQTGQFDPQRVLLGDLDGDGLDDIVYVESNRITFWINQGGERWSAPITINDTPPLTEVDAVRLVDTLGSGMAGVLWTFDQLPGVGSNYKFLDLTGGLKPYLLEKMDNHIGAVTRIQYASSTQFYLADFEKPQTHWKTPLPFPVQVVERVEVIDEISQGKLAADYNYHHGYWDGAEREFRGFGMVEQRDTETFESFNENGLHSGGQGFERITQAQFSPPTLTKTWFHLGAVGDEFAERREADFSSEYWPEDPPLFARPKETETLLARLQPGEHADVFRSLRGVVLRSELFALDGTKQSDRPYTVTENQYAVQEESPQATPGKGRRRIFFPHPIAQRVTQWERGDDPMTRFTFSSNYDKFGQPRQKTKIACPRGWRKLSDAPKQAYLATLTRVAFAEPPDAERYIHDRVALSTTFEALQTAGKSIMDLAHLPDGSPNLKAITQVVNFYDGPAFTGLPFGQIGSFGALVRSESLVLTDEVLAKAYPAGDPTLAQDDPPPYFASSGSPAWPPGYPSEFATRYATDQHTDPTRPELNITPLNYGFAAGGVGSPFQPGYYVATTRQSYDFQTNPSGRGRGLLGARRDPLGRDTPEHDTVISYDAFDLSPVAVAGPAGLTTRAEYDYRVMQLRLVTDPNENQNEFRFSPLGLLQEILVRGKPGAKQGDQARASTRFDYDFLAFVNSPPDKHLPISVHTTKHEHHDTETDVAQPERDATLETVEYSDGFGRLLQTRTQAEDVLFGDAALDAPLFGNDVLPANQDDAVGTRAPVTGRQREQNDPPNVVVSGWQVYNNKGKVIEKFEPFFSKGFDYLSPDDEQLQFRRDVLGQKVTMFYDPRGQVIRTVNPDGSEQRVIYGVPKALDAPEDFDPMPWEAYTYDANDLAPLGEGPLPNGKTGPLVDRAPQHHHFTPVNVVIDALGRTLLAVERNRVDMASPIVEFTTRSSYDIRGNLLKVTDALGREAFRYTYNLEDQPLRTENTDAGVRRVILDVAGNEIERRDSKGALILQAFDSLHRPIRLWARDDGDSSVTLRQRLEYGDRGNPNQPSNERAANQAANRLGKLYKHYDEAGLLTYEEYDFKGNLLEKTRRVISDQAILITIDARAPGGPALDFRVDWQPAHSNLAGLEADLLDPGEYRNSMAYDALNRVKSTVYPLDQDGQRKVLHPHYNRAGALARVELDDQVYVERIAYNAKGQRSLTTLGNGVMTRYAYDPHTFRLLRLRSERYKQTNSLTYQPVGGLLQDFAYDYDLVGNIQTIHDRVPGSGVSPQPDHLERAFGYDAIYRLISATGRECKNLSRPHPEDENPPWCGYNSGKHGTPNQDNAPNLTRRYQESYSYDKVGNLTRLRHQALESGNPGGFTRTFTLLDGSNQLQRVTVGNGSNTAPYDYAYDANGNLTAETTSRHFEWDHSDQLKAFHNQAGSSEPSVRAHYLYGAGGMRVKKLVRRQGGRVESSTYIDGLFEHHNWHDNGQSGENDHLHVMDGQQRIALFQVGKAHPDDKGPAIQYHLGDHLGSSNLVVDSSGGFINREEYSPYGETSLGSFARKRYRFTGKERDEESELYYHGARYYAPWLGRWTSSDPAGIADGFNSYLYARNNPVHFVDLVGHESTSQVQAYEEGRQNDKSSQFRIPNIVGEGKTIRINGVEYVNHGGIFHTVQGEVKGAGRDSKKTSRFSLEEKVDQDIKSKKIEFNSKALSFSYKKIFKYYTADPTGKITISATINLNISPAGPSAGLTYSLNTSTISLSKTAEVLDTYFGALEVNQGPNGSLIPNSKLGFNFGPAKVSFEPLPPSITWSYEAHPKNLRINRFNTVISGTIQLSIKKTFKYLSPPLYILPEPVTHTESHRNFWGWVTAGVAGAAAGIATTGRAVASGIASAGRTIVSTVEEAAPMAAEIAGSL